MAPKESIFYEENDIKLDVDDVHTGPIAFVPPTISSLSITDLPSTKEISSYTRFSGIMYSLAASFIFTCAAFSLKPLGVNLVDALIFRYAFQIVVTLIFALYKHYSLFPGTITQIFLQILCCLTGSTGVFLYFIALRYAELSDVTTLCYTKVVWTVLFSICIYRERPSISLLIALPLTLLGVIFVTQPNFLFSSTTSSINQYRIIGLILSIITSFTAAINVLSFKRLISTSKEMKPSVINFQYCLVILILLIINQIYQKFVLHAGLTLTYIISWRYILASLICLTMIIPNILTQKAIKREHPAVFTLLGSADIIFSLILQNIFTSKRSNLFALLGSTLVIFSVIIIGLSKMLTDRHIQNKMKLLDHQTIKKDFEEKC